MRLRDENDELKRTLYEVDALLKKVKDD